jgi:hypothetical protein
VSFNLYIDYLNVDVTEQDSIALSRGEHVQRRKIAAHRRWMIASWAMAHAIGSDVQAIMPKMRAPNGQRIEL